MTENQDLMEPLENSQEQVVESAETVESIELRDNTSTGAVETIAEVIVEIEPSKETNEIIAEPVSNQHKEGPSTLLSTTEQEAYVQKAKANFKSINTELKGLGTFDIETLQSFKEFWDKAKVVGELFRTLKPLLKEDREILWLAFNYHCEKAKHAQEIRKALRNRFSVLKRDIILHKVNEAKQIAPTNPVKAIEILKVAMDWVKDNWNEYTFDTNLIAEGIHGVDGKLHKEDNDQCWSAWKETREWVNLLIQDANKDNYMSLKLELNPIAIEAVDGNPFDAIKAVKEFQQKLKATPMNQTEWKELNDALQQYWERANKRIDEDRQRRKQEQERKSQETQQRQQERTTRLEFNIARFAELIVKNTNVVERIEEQLTKLKEEQESARSDDFKLKVQGWIDEKQARVDDIKRANTELEEKLTDMRSKLVNNTEN